MAAELNTTVCSPAEVIWGHKLPRSLLWERVYHSESITAWIASSAADSRVMKIYRAQKEACKGSVHKRKGAAEGTDGPTLALCPLLSSHCIFICVRCYQSPECSNSSFVVSAPRLYSAVNPALCIFCIQICESTVMFSFGGLSKCLARLKIIMPFTFSARSYLTFHQRSHLFWQ